MHAPHARAVDFLHQRFEHGPRRFDELCGDLLKEIFPLLRSSVFTRCRSAAQADNQHIADQVRAKDFRPPAQEFLLKRDIPSQMAA